MTSYKLGGQLSKWHVFNKFLNVSYFIVVVVPITELLEFLIQTDLPDRKFDNYVIFWFVTQLVPRTVSRLPFPSGLLGIKFDN
jgi:hypothetical protein